MAKKQRAPEEKAGATPPPAIPEVDLPEMSGFGIHHDTASGKWNAVRVSNWGIVELLSPRPESKHAATARAFDAFRLHIANARRA